MTGALPRAQRLDLLDALRGSALLGILLLHAVEHWDFGASPEGYPAWLTALDGHAKHWAFLLFGGKAYAIFALMFGISFHITLQSWQAKADHPSVRFLWRLVLLGAIGYVHGLLFCGDILAVIAVLGLPLVLLNRLGTRALLAVAVLLLLQLPQWPEVVRVLSDAAYQPGYPRHWGLYGQTEPVYAHGNFADVLAINTWTGQAAKWWWVLETWRWPQMLGLFVCGLQVGRSGVLHEPARLRRLAWRALAAGIAGSLLMWLVGQGVDTLGLQGLRHMAVANLVKMLGNLAQMAVWAGGFVLLYGWARTGRLLALLAPYGRMSLTGYVTQAVIGVPFFYGFGLAMYRHVGPFMALGFGIGVFVLQLAFARWWLARYAYGPLEWLWRAATLRTLQLPLRRTSMGLAGN
ncbi:hypothetical protein ASC95_28995 [Pelomonas sp. Root1217]|uniref:DUF418 domain-containing protein n=1 Tax=Pelomonas sp. Root1217 TaxID=1736430 RepID=UPI00070D6EAC|nr:DUF418 domain-containing protein [Pelomonas sp. Root1217]KQV55584.1 hypothetical protein ASC95_28995 [Pelomonas sp. Root1217]